MTAPKCTRILFASDLHASDRCFRKFLRAAASPSGPEVLIIGGDITGKYLVPIVEAPAGRWSASFEGQGVDFSLETEVCRFESLLRDKGAYPWRCDGESSARFQKDSAYQDEVDRMLRSERLLEWLQWADDSLTNTSRRVFISGGNDDPWYIDDILRRSESLICPDGEVHPISDSLTMLSCGVANQTPWNCPRDLPEEEITLRIERLAVTVQDFGSCVFNLHCPPFGTLLDRAPKLDQEMRVVASAFGVEEVSVGSRAVRDAIERYQPTASLHGHIHESRGFQRIGRTMALNPGSEYAVGRLNVAILEFFGSVLHDFHLLVDLT